MRVHKVGRAPHPRDPHEAILWALIAEWDDITLEEMRGHLREERTLTVGLDTL